MGKINWIKRMIRKFTSQRIKLEERYTLNRKYLGRSEDLKIFIEKRQYHCDMLGIKFSVIEDDFPDCQYGFVELLQNGKTVESVLLKRGDLGLVLWVEFGNRTV
jgi:hypothetical protein